MLRIWHSDCALCVIGNEFPCRQPHNPSATLLRGPTTLPQGWKPLAVSRRKTPDDKMISWNEVASNLPKRFCMVGTRYFASATNCWYSILYHNYGRTWSIESTEKVGRGAILPFFLLITYGHSQLSTIGGECFFVADGVQAFRGEALAQVVDFVVVLLKKKGGLFV